VNSKISPLDLVEDGPRRFSRQRRMSQEIEEILDGPLKVDVVLPEGVVGIKDEILALFSRPVPHIAFPSIALRGFLDRKPSSDSIVSRQGNLDAGAMADAARQGNRSTVRFHNRSADRETQSCPSIGPRAARVDSIEPIEDPLLVSGLDTATSIGHPQLHLSGGRSTADSHSPRARCVGERVINQIDQDLDEQILICLDWSRLRFSP
jgi:hypothetical protein